MDISIWQKYKNMYLQKLRSDIDIITSLPDPLFYEMQIECSGINDESCINNWVNKLEEIGIKNNTSVLYYFSFDACNMEQVLIKAQNQKNIKVTTGQQVARSMPKINKSNKDICNGILYVGKTNANFISRFKHHLGLIDSNTYALQLKYWATSFQLSLFVAPFNLESNQLPYLENLETALHQSLKPLLGRSGH